MKRTAQTALFGLLLVTRAAATAPDATRFTFPGIVLNDGAPADVYASVTKKTASGEPGFRVSCLYEAPWHIMYLGRYHGERKSTPAQESLGGPEVLAYCVEHYQVRERPPMAPHLHPGLGALPW